MDDAIPEELLVEQATALRRLARKLVLDAAAADDLVQATLARALERGPRPHPDPRAWLGRVLRNAAREERRLAGRRGERERAVARPEGTPSPAELVERHDARLAVARAVRELEEPYREAILLRWFEDLPPRRIAARLGVPVKTVDARLHRGLAKLRERLDREHGGDRRAWCALLLPLAGLRELAPLSAGALLMKSKLALAAAAILIAAGILYVRGDAPTPLEPTPGPQQAAAGAPDLASDAPELATDPAPAGRQLAQAAPAAQQAALGPEGSCWLASGEPAPGVRLRWSSDAGGAGALTSDADGRFHLPAGCESARLACADERYVALFDHEWYAEGPPPVVVVAPRVAAAGLALDDQRAPLKGARIEIELPADLRARVPADLTEARARRLMVESDAEGRFRVDGVPGLQGLRCVALKAGYEAAAVALSAAGDEALELVLRRPAERARLEGRVVDAANAPLAGARVALGLLPATTDEEGRFAFEYDATSPPERLLAVAQGLLPEQLERGGAAWPPFVELRLEREPLSLRGVVLDVAGQPLPNATVWIEEPTVLASWSGGFWLVESSVRPRQELQLRVATDARGRFALEGLMARDYELRALDPARAWQLVAGSFPAGAEDVVIRFPAEGLFARLEGRVVDAFGAPVTDVSVAVATSLLAARDADGTAYYNGFNGPSADVDEQGRFVLEEVPRADARLEVMGEELEDGQDFAVPESADEPLLLRVARRCELVVANPPGAAAAASFSLLDSGGNPVFLTRREPGRIEQLQSAPLAEGRSELLTAPDTAATLVLRDAAGNELRRMPVRLRAGERNELK